MMANRPLNVQTTVQEYISSVPDFAAYKLTDWSYIVRYSFYSTFHMDIPSAHGAFMNYISIYIMLIIPELLHPTTVAKTWCMSP